MEPEHPEGAGVKPEREFQDMHNDGEQIHVDDTEASGGSKEGVVRWVLLGGMLLAILLLSIVWIIPALSQGDVEEEATVTGKVEATQDESGTDGVLGVENADSVEPKVQEQDGLSTVEN